MKFIIPQKEELTREVIKEDFFPKYYPEMKVRQGWWYILGRYVMLQKNPFVCAKFTVKQKDDEGKTHIRIEKDQNKWAYIIAAPIINSLVHGDFYDDLYRNFNEWIIKKYGLSKDEIILTEPFARTKFYINIFLIAAIIVGILLFIFDQMDLYSYHENQSLWEHFLNCIPTGRRFEDLPIILLMYGVISGIIYYFMKRKKDERNEKIERILGLKIQAYKSKNKALKRIISVFLWVCLYVALFFGVALIPNLIFNMRTSGEGEIDLYEDNLPAYVEEIINQENPNPDDYFSIEYLTPDILWVSHDGIDSFYDLNGKPTYNLIIWAIEYRDSYEIFAIIAAILLGVIYYFWRKKRKGDVDVTSVDFGRTIRNERTEDGDATLKL